MVNAFYPGKVWLDTNGNRIQAHGGSVFYEDGTYYWYGENKEGVDGTNDIWQQGVRCYASKDLYNWEDMGNIIPPRPEDANSSLHPRSHAERPHILYNTKTGKYVCWIKIMEANGDQTETVLTADRFLGPYTVVRERLHPLGMNAGDFDLVADADGNGYYYFEKVHSELICADLTADYTDVAGTYSRHFPHPCPPDVREAPAHFMRNGRHYLITSGTTGYLPNPSQTAVADDWHGPFTVVGDPHPTDGSRTSFHSQISCIFKVQGKKDLYIACADRWLPQDMDLPYPFYAEVFRSMFSGRGGEVAVMAEKAGITPQQLQVVTGGTYNTSVSDYVWLPLRFEDRPDGTAAVFIDWKEEWRLEDYE